MSFRLRIPAVSSWAIKTFAVPPLAPSPEDPIVADPRNSLLLTDLSENLLRYDSNNDDFSGESPTVNDRAAVEYRLFDADGTLVGQTRGIGQMLYKRDSDGHFIAHFSAEIKLAAGNVIRTGGLVDDALLTAGEQATIAAVGIAGPFRGAVGFRQFRPVVPHESYVSNIVLYRR
jgi:hypothetical protein